MKTVFTILVITLSFSFYSQKNDIYPQVYLSGSSSKSAKLGDGKLVVKQKQPSGEFLSYTVISYTIFVPGIRIALKGKENKIKPNYIKLIKSSGTKEFAIEVKYKRGNATNLVSNAFTLN